MGDLTCTQMETELARRITQLPTGASSAAQNAVNRAIRWINRQGSFSFQLTDPTTITIPANGIVAMPATMDPGKAHSLQNPNGMPIRRESVSAIWGAANYNTPSDLGFDVYALTRTKIICFPPQVTQKICPIMYHTLTTDISLAQTSNLPRDFDDLIIDLAEAEETRIYGVGTMWPQMLARAQDQIRVLLNAYRTSTMQPMGSDEADQLIQEKTAKGRA